MRSPYETPQFSIRVPKPLLDKIEAEIFQTQAQWQKDHGYAPRHRLTSRTDVILDLLREAFAAREAKAKATTSADVVSPKPVAAAAGLSPKAAATSPTPARSRRPAVSPTRQARTPATRRKLAPAPRKKAAKPAKPARRRR